LTVTILVSIWTVSITAETTHDEGPIFQTDL
jgi:hypothetical protein